MLDNSAERLIVLIRAILRRENDPGSWSLHKARDYKMMRVVITT